MYVMYNVNVNDNTNHSPKFPGVRMEDSTADKVVSVFETSKLCKKIHYDYDIVGFS